jgi:hypothetical protein
MSKTAEWTKTDVIALMALVLGLPAAIAAVIYVAQEWTRNRRRGEWSSFLIVVVHTVKFRTTAARFE